MSKINMFDKEIYKQEPIVKVITRNIEKLIRNKIEDSKNTKRIITRKDICNDLGITQQALINYTTDRIPKYEMLEKIKNYFNTSYAFLFGEINGQNINNVNISAELGLNDDSINTLRENTKSSNLLSLNTINNIINDKLFIEKYSEIVLLRKLNIKSMRSKDELKELYDYKIYNLSHIIDKSIDKIDINDIKTPENINNFINIDKLNSIFNKNK